MKHEKSLRYETNQEVVKKQLREDLQRKYLKYL